MTEAQKKALEIYSKFEKMSIDNEMNIPAYLITEMSHIAINLLWQEDIHKDFWNEVTEELIKLNL